MNPNRVKTPQQAVAFLTDAALATVESMARKGSTSLAGEFRRQVEIAQQGVNWMRSMNIDPGSTRVAQLERHGWSVASWATQTEIEFGYAVQSQLDLAEPRALLRNM